MRPAVVSLTAVLLSGCSPSAPEPLLIDAFVERSPTLACEPARLEPGPPMVTLLEEVDDSLLVAIAPLAREVILLTHDLRPARRIAYEEEGPTQLVDPRDVALLGDSLLVVADRSARRLKLLGLDGEDRGAIELGFPAERVLPHRDGLLVASLILAPDQTELLYLVVGEERRPLGVRPIAVADWQLRTLGNLVALAPAGGDRFIVAHQHLEPAAHLVDFRNGQRDPVVRAATVPLPDGVRDAVGRLPTRPFTEETLMQILTPVLDAAPDRASGDLLYLTRSGRRAPAGYMEKAVIRVDRELRYRASHLLPLNAGRIAYLSRTREIVAVAEDDRWYRCPLPEPAEP